MVGIEEQNSIEATLAINYDRQEIFQKFSTDTIALMIRYTDGYSYSPAGVGNVYNFTDNIKRITYGQLFSGYESDRFFIPIAPSLNGFPFDDIQIIPIVTLYINGVYSKVNFTIQKRISGRILSHSDKYKKVVLLTRTSTEKYLVIISSIIFILLTLILTYGIAKSKNGLNTVEELVAVAGYILATAGFKEILGINRTNGTSALEIFVILVPLISVFLGSYIHCIRLKRLQRFNNSNMLV